MAFLKATIQTGIKQNRKNYKNFCYWLNGVDVTDQNLDEFTPFITGTSRIFVHKLPPVMEQLDPGMCENFKSLVETGYTRIDGIQDTTVEFTDFEGGFNGQKFKNVSLVSNETDTLTITVYEQSGSPVREFLDTWVNAVRDQYSGIAHYHGLFDSKELGKNIVYGERSHTAEFIYVVMDPTGRAIEYACLFAHAFPTKVPKSHLNYESRGRNNVQMDLEFAVQMYESPAINALAAYYMINSTVDYNYLNFTVSKPKYGYCDPKPYSTDNRVAEPFKSAEVAAKYGKDYLQGVQDSTEYEYGAAEGYDGMDSVTFVSDRTTANQRASGIVVPEDSSAYKSSNTTV